MNETVTRPTPPGWLRDPMPLTPPPEWNQGEEAWARAREVLRAREWEKAEELQKVAAVEALLDDRWVKEDGGFGVCAVCGRPKPGYGAYLVHLAKQEWCYCPKHRITWNIGSNLLSGWQHEDLASQSANARMLDGFSVVDCDGKRLGYVFEADTAIQWIEQFWNRP